MATAAERKARQRERDRATIASNHPEEWNERQCLAVLADSNSREHAREAWGQLGGLRGWCDSHTPDAASELGQVVGEIMRRVGAGEALSFVLDSVATKARLAGKPKDTADLPGVLEALPAPQPGHALVAVKLTNAASGSDRKAIKRVAPGLAHADGKMTGRGGAYVGEVASDSLPTLKALVEKVEGRMEVRQ